MSRFCGRCGTPLNPDGLCPNCDAMPNQNVGSFQGNQNNTVYARFDAADEPDSANIPQNQPPVAYEGNIPMQPPAPMNNPKPPQPSSNGDNGKKNKRRSRPRKKANWPLRIGCIAVGVCVLAGGICALIYNNVVYIPSASETLTLSVDNKIYGEERDYFIITDKKITDKEITDEDSALDAAKKFTLDLGYDSIADEYYLLDDPTQVGGYTYYRFQECYKGYPVVGRTMTIIADADGNSCGASTNVINFEKNFKTDIKDFEKDDVIDSLKGFENQGIEVNVNAYTKSIYSFDRCEKPLMAYEVLAVVNNRNFRMFVDPEEGKIINSYCLDSGSATTLQGNMSGVMNNPQKFSGELQGAKFVTSDPDRKITVYNSDKGSSTIAIQYIDHDDKSYYNRRYNPGNAEYTPNDEVCVIYDESGEYYEYDRDKGKFVKDDIEISLDDLNEDGYIVFNLNSNKVLNPVSSDDRTIKDELAVRLMVKTAQTYDFYKDVLDREGYDGSGGTMFAVCNDNLNSQPEKAYSAGDNDGFSMITFGYDNPMEWDDIAHEYTHSVEQSISSLFYQNESGAIMEGYSDVFGEIIEDYCFETMTGEELKHANLNGECDWTADDRFIAMPLMNELPDTYGGTYFEEKPDDDDWQESNMGINNDFGSVHDNSAVISHLAYLMTNGDNEDSNLTMEDIAHLWYRTLYLLPSDCTFSAFRDCMELTADMMVSNGDLTEEKRDYVSDCFDKANIQSTRYSSDTKIVVVSEDPKKKYKVKIEGKEFKLVTLKDYSKEFVLTDGKKNDDGLFEAYEELELPDGRYTVKVIDEDDKVNYFEREILVMTEGKFPQQNKENTSAKFFFIKPKEIEMPTATDPTEGAAGSVPTDPTAGGGAGSVPTDPTAGGAAGSVPTDIPTN